MCLVTVAIASYNNGKYIERCVESVIQQSYSDLEILIVDDGSTDDTQSRLKQYLRDCRIKIIVKENGGLASVRQKSLDIANGKYICFIDADDYLEQHYVEFMLRKLSNDGTDICVCSTSFIDEKDVQIESETRDYSCNDSEKPICVTPSFIVNNPKSLTQLHLGDSWNKMYEVNFIRRSGVCFNMPKGYNGTDTLFNRLLVFHSPSYSTIKDQLYKHIIYSYSAVHRKNKDLLTTYLTIADRSMKEASALGIMNELKSYILCNYLSSIYYVCVDVAKESNSVYECRSKINHIYKKHKYFLDSNLIHDDELPIIDRFVIKIFIYLFTYTRWLVPYFLIVRKKIKI